MEICSVNIHTKKTYYSPSQILSMMRQLHGNSISVHIKYFVQGQTGEWAFVFPGSWSRIGYDKYNELWSEANYNRCCGWETFGYPYDSDGGASRIRSHGYVYTTSGFAYHSPYPQYHERRFGNPELVLRSNFLHQFAIQQY